MGFRDVAVGRIKGLATFSGFFLSSDIPKVKPWPNGPASRGKLKTCCLLVSLSGQASGELTLTCDDLHSLWPR